MADPPIYRSIANELRARIKEHLPGYQPGDIIPGYPAIAQEFGVASATASKVIDVLNREGLIRSTRGRGSMVRAIPPVRRLHATRFRVDYRERGRGAYAAELAEMGYAGRTRYLLLGETPAPGDDDHNGTPSTAELLGVTPGEPVFARRRVMYAAPVDDEGRIDYRLEEPMQIATSYIPLDVARLNPGDETTPGLMVADSGVGGIYSRLADVGLAPVRWPELVGARLVSGMEATELGMDASATVLTVDRQAVTCEGQVVEVCRHVMPPGNFVLVYESGENPTGS